MILLVLWMSICLIILTVLADHHVNLFDAYDCSWPDKIQDVGYSVMTNCITDRRIVKTKNVTYQLLQKERHLRAEGWTCKMEKTKTVTYCGVYDHQTTYDPQTFYDFAVPVSASLCRDMWLTKSFNGPREKVFPLQINSINNIDYFEVGRSYIEHGEVKCEGSDFQLTVGGSDVTLHRAVVAIKLKIYLQEEGMMIDDQEVIAHSTQVRLPCPPISGQCQTMTGTYVWTVPTDRCELAVTRTVTGTVATNSLGQEVFMSTDGSLTRFVKRPTVQRCNRIVHSTNYADWYLYPVDNPQPFERKIAPGSMSTVTFVQNRDDFLFSYTADAIKREFMSVIKGDCERQEQLSRLSWYMQLKEPGITTWLLGNGTFATSNGEVIYQYGCRALKVRARETTECYQALPVEPLEPLKSHAVRVNTGTAGTTTTSKPGKEEEVLNHVLLENDRPLFMEPLTRRLTHQGIVMPCTLQFPPKYKNINEGWISASKQIIGASSPMLPSDIDERKSAFDETHRPDFSDGGVYDKKDLDAMERYQDFNRATAALGATFIHQMPHHYNLDYNVGPEDLFKTYQDPRSWMSGLWGRIITFLHEWGEAASVLISLYILGRLALRIFEWGYYVFVLRDIHGCGRILCWIPFMSLFLLQAYRDSPFGQQKRSERVQKGIVKSQKKRGKEQKDVPPRHEYEEPNPILKDKEPQPLFSGVAVFTDDLHLPGVAPPIKPRRPPAPPPEPPTVTGPYPNLVKEIQEENTYVRL